MGRPNGWFAHNEYPSVLDFALASSYGKAFNEKGAHVVLDNPVSQESRSDVFRLKPNIEVVKTLIHHGAIISDSCLSASRKLPDKSFIRFLEQSQKNGTTATPPVPVSMSLPPPPPLPQPPQAGRNRQHLMSAAFRVTSTRVPAPTAS